MDSMGCRQILIKLFLKSVAAVNPAKLITENLKIDGKNLVVCDKVYDVERNIYLIGFGKAVLGMAVKCEQILGNHIKRGVICGPENIRKVFEKNSEYSLKPGSVIELQEGARDNLPDENAEKGADAIIELVKSLNVNTDNLIVLISGGGSALFPKPKPPISLEEKLDTINLLFSSGADINEVNTVRKQLSVVKGGGLALLSHPVKTICLIISDVIGNPLDIIASGPTVLNSDKKFAALEILQKYNLTNKVPINVLNKLNEPNRELNQLDNSFSHVDNFIIGSNTKALKAGKQFADSMGFKSVILSTKVKGSVYETAEFYMNLLSEILNCLQNPGNISIKRDELVKECIFDIEENFFDELDTVVNEVNTEKLCILAGGETTVKVKGSGKGGRNQELVLIVCLKLHHLKLKHPELFQKYDVTFLSAGTDGADGPTDAAGAVGDSTVIVKAMGCNLDVDEYLRENNSYDFFSRLDNGSFLIKTGHTGTNVMDIHSLAICRR